METCTMNKSAVTLEGSATIIREYLYFAINSVLYQRGVYSPKTFKLGKEFGLPLLVTIDEPLKQYLSKVLDTMRDWITDRKLRVVCLFIKDKASDETLESWEFFVRYREGPCDGEEGGEDVAVVQREIRKVLRQISCSITYLPLLDTAVSFELKAYTSHDVVPQVCKESQPNEIKNVQRVQLSNIATGYHNVDTVVSYKVM
ncbi:mitotic spindle assembly checkpoint protein MAD2A-like [Bacillus rossius redtenbacheri]|uniref:mitotic spindle assembly checkpoint protein MAD2A-like n=1 Tax=Bacillus rossius redtenbacheri TaxID=93214 RepID=UPI002FDE2E56